MSTNFDFLKTDQWSYPRLAGQCSACVERKKPDLQVGDLRRRDIAEWV